MSTSANEAQDEGADKQSLDELEETNHAAGDAEAVHFEPISLLDEGDRNINANGTSPTTPAKRGRGRPKGSKNKKAASTSAAGSPTTPVAGRKRGRPPKEKKEDSGEEPPPKRPRGRPPKNPKPIPAEGGTSAEAGESSVKKKRGRPPKKSTT
ncbi:hypothetical protein B0H34DRAFT_672269 [Crassisporium funariophilum]|nr:hypothetical protein B0H34DRAFT_672269 [Crassisporium funariophilum]